MCLCLTLISASVSLNFGLPFEPEPGLVIITPPQWLCLQTVTLLVSLHELTLAESFYQLNPGLKVCFHNKCTKHTKWVLQYHLSPPQWQ